MPVIIVDNITKDYGHGRGVFNVSFTVEEGEVFGFVGPNGAGKTTTIRHIMGFSKPQNGSTCVNGFDSWKYADIIQKELGYLPGEIALPENLTGTEFIAMMAELRGVEDMSYTNHLLERFDLNPSGNLKRMSLGMKRKLAIVTAFMHDPRVLVLDEPTSGLDPLMEDIFVEFIKDEKKRGKTILMSSHIFKVVDNTSSRIAIIKDGRIVTTVLTEDIRHNENKTYKLEFVDRKHFERFCGSGFNIISVKPSINQVRVSVMDKDINVFIMQIAEYDLKFFSEIKFTLEDYFMRFYKRDEIAGEA
ncbi:MAG: ABC transporter ATP-binding protein [Anaerolineaceae bacterium]